MKVAAIVPAAGRGKRIRSKIQKPYIELCGKPIIAHTLLKLSKNKSIAEIIVAVNRKSVDKVKRDIIAKFRIKKTKVVAGGKERKDSVFNALRNVSEDVDYVLIHDCARPLVTDKVIIASLKTAQRFNVSVVAVPVKPTLKLIGKNGRISRTPDRRNFWEAQTPQVFKKSLLEKAYKRLGRISASLTDDSMLVERLGVKPKVVLGSYSNIKITTQEDLALAKILYRP